MQPKVYPLEFTKLSVLINLISSSFVFAICLFVKNEDMICYAQPIHGKGALALGHFSTRAILSHTMTELLLICIFVIKNSHSLQIT